MRRLAIFDFCETIVDFQTADAFVEFIATKRPSNLVKYINLIIKPLKKLHLIPGFLHKRLQLLKLRGVGEKDLDDLAKEFLNSNLLPRENKNIVEKIEWHKKKGDYVIIVSGGYSPYIDEYAKFKRIDKAIATDLQIKHNNLTGFIYGFNCMGKNKVKKLRRLVDLSKFDLNNSYVYSDNMSDLPLFNLVANKVLVTGRDYNPEEVYWKGHIEKI